MVRTSFTRVSSEQDLSGEQVRATAERLHLKKLRMEFNWQYMIFPPDDILPDQDYDQQAERCEIRLPPMFTKSPPLMISQLPLDVIRRFCFKDCMVYITRPKQCRSHWRQDFFWRIYRRWYPSRAQDTDISHTNFFCHLADFLPSPRLSMSQMIGQVTAFHKRFCLELERKIPDLPELQLAENPAGRPVDRSLLFPMAVYKLRPTFGKCFLIINDNTYDETRHFERTKQDPGAIIVWLQADDVVEILDDMTRLVGDGIPDEVRAFRCETLESAVQSVLVYTGDPERSVRKQESHGYYKEVLDQTETDFDQLCHCRWCPNAK